MSWRNRITKTVTKIEGRNAALAGWPVDSVFIGYTATSPATLLGGGTWVRISEGRMLIGQNAADTTCDTLGETGGAKTHTIAATNMDTHVHNMTHSHDLRMRPAAGAQTGQASGAGGAAAIDINTGLNSFIGDTTNGGSQLNQTPVNHMNPYLTVYIWRRTA